MSPSNNVGAIGSPAAQADRQARGRQPHYEVNGKGQHVTQPVVPWTNSIHHSRKISRKTNLEYSEIVAFCIGLSS